MIPSELTKASLPHAAGIKSLSTIKHLIVDRDRVLNEELEGGAHLGDPDRFYWLPGVLNALAHLRTMGVRVSVATNQSGIGRGLITELELVIHRTLPPGDRCGRD